MKAVSIIPVSQNGDKRVVRAVIVADSVPSPLPTTGEGIAGMNRNMLFAPMSCIYVVGEADKKVFIANESGVFIAQ